MTKKLNLCLFIPSLLMAVLLPAGIAAENVGNDSLQGQLDEIKTRLENMEKSQQEIAAKDDKILEELDRLRIWVHRK